MKRYVQMYAAIVLAAVIVLAGCSNSAPSNQGSSNSNDENVKLRISWWGSQVRNDGTLKVLDMYTDLHPNVTFEPEYTSFADYWDRLASVAAANNIPDVFQHDYAYIQQYANKDLLLPLDEYVESGLLDLSNVDESVIDAGRINGKLYGINIAINSRALIYDPALFEKAGVPLPDENFTWDDFINAALTIKEKLGIYGAGAIAGMDYEGFLHYLRQNGVTLYSEDGTGLGYDDDKYFSEFFGMELKLAKAGAIPMPSERLEVKGVGDDFIVSGKAAMGGYVKHSNNIDEVTKNAGRPLALAIYPKGENEVQPGLFVKPSMFLTISSKTAHPEEAVKFVNYFLNDIPANEVLAAERGVPASTAVREALKPMMSDANKLQFEYMDLVSQHSSPNDPPEPPGHAEVMTILKNVQQQVVYERITPEEGAKSFREQAEAVLGN